MTAALEMSHTRMVYDTASGELLALADISFAVQPGEFVSVLGPSGCGKSTLLALASGLVFPTKGEVRVAARRVERPVTDIGIVFQTDVLLDWRRALGNILMQVEMRGMRIADYRQKAVDLLRVVGLAGFEEKYPFELSGGMRQRVALCRALIHDPPLLLMDEPFGALDALTREQMRTDLEELWMQTGKTVLFITHSIDEAVLLADRVIVMSPRPGRIEQIYDIALPRPRGLAARSHPLFIAAAQKITDLVLAKGILRGQSP